MSKLTSLNRRNFIKASTLGTGGLVLGFYLPMAGKANNIIKTPNAVTYHAPNAFIKIGTDESINIIVNHAEMGQGVYTSLCQIVADELDVDWKNIKAVHAPFSPDYNHTVFPMQLTGGSTSVNTEWQRLRNVAASARQMLIEAAAKEWNVTASTLKAENGVVKNGSKELTYGQLAEKATQITPPKEVTLKDKKDFKYIGKSMPRTDTPIKVNGEAIFGMDVSLPGMLVAVVQRPPVFGGKIRSFDAEKAKAIPGVKHVVHIDRGVAVVADGFWPAKKGREALEIEWDLGANKDLSTKSHGDKYKALLKQKGATAENRGDVNTAFAKAAKTVEATYELPYLAHTPMEPLNCVADVKSNQCTLYLGTQSQTIEAGAIAQALGIPLENIKVQLQYLGGGFGRRVTLDAHVAIEAAQISSKVNAPVKLIWTREDDIKGGYYRSRTLTTMKGAIDNAKQLNALESKIVSESIMMGTPWEPMMVKNGVDTVAVEGMMHSPYHVPNVNVEWIYGDTKEIPVLWWRSVGHSRNGFVMETFIDELAEAAGKDEYEFRKELLKDDPRSLDALDLAVSKSPWGKQIPDGHALGMAVHTSFGSSVAYVAEVSIENNWPKVHKVWAAIDCGPYVNPNGLKAQVEGGAIFGLTAAFYGEITLKNGSVKQSNFHDYKMLRMHEAPEIEVHIVKSNKQMGGAGEPGVPPIAPAVANALYKLTGKRIHKLPFDKNDFVKKGVS